MRNLSKSKIIAFRQCPKRLWLEIHKRELRDDSSSEAIFTNGNQVGEIARKIYDPANTGITIDRDELGHDVALARSAALFAEGKAPIFEAGVTIEGVLAYADVMLPEIQDSNLAWKMIEVKSSTGVRDYHRDDIAVQAYIATSMGIRLSSISLAHVDRSFVYPGDGNYQGLLFENDLMEEAFSRSGEVREWIAGAHAVAELPDEPEIETGPQCSNPFTCCFCDYCNRDKVVGPTPEYPISSLPNLKGWRRDAVEAEETDDLRGIPDDLLTDLQLRVKQCSVSGIPFFDAAGAASDLEPHGFPAYFLDFETVMFGVPIWKGTRPYQQLPFQFSLHVLQADGSLEHHSFLDLSGTDPSRSCAQLLVDLCGDQGPVIAYYASFERGRMWELAERFPDLAPELEAIIDRIVDLLPIARSRYYHPSQHGSWSIKAVLPALCPDLSYDDLDGVQDGMMAGDAFMEAINPSTTPARKQEIELQLVEYCKLDTFAMVRLWEKFSGKVY